MSGGWIARKSGYLVRLRYADGRRFVAKLSHATSDAEADKIVADMRAIIARLSGANRLDLVPMMLKQVASASTANVRGTIRRASESIQSSELDARRSRILPFQDFAHKLVNGDLEREFPDHVRPRTEKARADDGARLRLYINPVIGKMPIDVVTLDDCDSVMRKLPGRLAPATRRHVAQILHRIFTLAVTPCRVLKVSPIPPRWMPRIHSQPTFSFLYPDEERQLLECAEVPLVYRVLYGTFGREGARLSELLKATVGHFDLERGVFRLDRNKTRNARMWRIDSGTHAALRIWVKSFHPLRNSRSFAEAPMFVDPSGEPVTPNGAARRFRSHLKLADVKRAELFEATDERSPIRVHDLRAGFVTTSLANGKSEAWIMDRTGHKSSIMIAKYRRAARMASELELGTWAPMNEAIPELTIRPAGIKVGSGGGKSGRN